MKVNFETATKETFDPHVGKGFSVRLRDGEITLLLDNTKLLGADGLRDNAVEVDGREIPPRIPFALTFEGPALPVLPQGTYEIVHEDTGPLHIFLLPFRQDKDCVLYEAVFG